MILHLVAKKEWNTKPASIPYAPDAFSKDGFIHCTQGEALLLQVANRFYKDVPGDFLVLDIDESKVQSALKWEAASDVAPAAPEPAPPLAAPVANTPAEPMPPEAKAEFGATPEAPAAPPATTEPTPSGAGPLFPHIYGPLNRDAIVGIRRAVRASDGVFIRFVLMETAPQGMNLKKPSELAHDLVDATGEFSDALARYKDHLEAHMDELDKNIKDKLN